MLPTGIPVFLLVMLLPTGIPANILCVTDRYTCVLLVSQDINHTCTLYASFNAKLAEVLNNLKEHRARLCAFHTTKLFSFGKTSSQLSECQNSQIKGGNSYSRWLRCQNYIQTILHIVASMQIYIDETITRIKTCVSANKCISPWIETKLQTVSLSFDVFFILGIPDFH